MNTTDLFLQKLPPQNIEAEQSVLGAILLDNQAMNKALEILSAADFYKEAHRRIFNAMLDLYERGEAVDLIMLTEVLRQKNELEQVGGAAYLTSLVNLVPTAANVKVHSRIVREKALLRNLIQVSTDLVARGMEETERVEDLLDEAERHIFSISEKKIRPSFVSIKEIVKNSFEIIEHRYEKKEKVTGLPTGFVDLDELTAGLHPGDLIVVAGRPSMGKTAFSLCIAQHVGIEKRETVGIFSLEMSKEQLVLRMLCSEAWVDGNKLRSGYLGHEDWPRLTAAAGRLSEAPIYIDDTPAISILEMRAKARRLKAERGLGLMIVDYLQLVRGRGDADTREQEISEISRSLKALSKELAIPVLAISQLSRAVESRVDKRPMLSDLRECVTGDTPVWLQDGRRIPIRELVGSTPAVWAISPEGKVITAKSGRVWCVGHRPVFKVVLASGRVIRATADHRLLGLNGWLRVSDLRMGERLAIARQIPEPPDALEWPENRIILLAHLIGDGSYLSHQPLRYTTSSEENSHAVAVAAQEEFGVEVKRYPGRGRWHQLVFSGNGNRWHPAGMNRWLRDQGIFNQHSHEKRLPREVFRLKQRQIELLLRHLWATDGTVWRRDPGSRGASVISFTTNSTGLAHDVAALLLRIGIVARIRTVHHLKYRTWYHVAVSGAEQQRLFLERVGGFGPRKFAADQLAYALATVNPNTNVDTLPHEVFGRIRQIMAKRGISQRAMASLRGTSYGGSSHFRFSPSRKVVAEYAEHLDNEALRILATNDLFWDAVVEVVPDGEEEVFDLTVPGPASWLADGIASHNSGAIEQDADVVVFLYRDEVYNEKTEEKGISEVLIRKQRNGPVGTLKLKFFDKFTRFENLEQRHTETHR